jgi:hypothetical protein
MKKQKQLESEEDKLIREYWVRRSIRDKNRQEFWDDVRGKSERGKRMNGCVLLVFIILGIICVIAAIFGEI